MGQFFNGTAFTTAALTGFIMFLASTDLDLIGTAMCSN